MFGFCSFCKKALLGEIVPQEGLFCFPVMLIQ